MTHDLNMLIRPQSSLFDIHDLIVITDLRAVIVTRDLKILTRPQ